MTHATPMLETHPSPAGTLPTAALADLLHQLEECAQSCLICADACLAEEMVADLRRCIRLNLDCADLCRTTAAVLSRQIAPDPATERALLEACRAACAACGAECGSHAEMHEHCRVCAEACQRCESACSKALQQLGS
ncbi:MAG TPA: four-helix bundle copper-binding protein [Acidimicrobiales bacterium]|nr:four-helix bundle copper-binding protein [Acidimicrobiales bacterium]